MSNRSVSRKTAPRGGKKPISQNMLVTLISAGATIFAALLALVPNIIDAMRPEPTATMISTSTITPIPPTFTPAPTFTSTVTLTPTPEPPTLTPTPEVGIFGAYLSQDENGEHKTESFSPVQTIYLFFNLRDPSGLNQVRIVWSVVEVPGFKPGAIINQTDDVIKKDTYSIQANKNPWDSGKYKVELYLNEILDETIEFEILK